LPLFGVVVFLVLTGLILYYFSEPSFRHYIRTKWSLKHLMVFHVWRIAAGALFLYYGNQGLLPDTFVDRAAYGDILAGSLVPVVILLGEKRWTYWAFNIIGFGDFLLAVGTGLWLTLSGNMEMAPIATLPLLLIPWFGVPISGVSHIMAFDRLWNGRKE
jgi:hypothetical protein